MGRSSTEKYKVSLSDEERDFIKKNQKQGTHSSRVLYRQQILLLLDKGVSVNDVTKELNVSKPTIYSTVKRYKEGGVLDLKDKPRSGRPEVVSGEVKASIIATACTDAPKGRSRWTLRLLADHIVQLEILPSISTNTIGRILKKTR